MHEQLHDLLLDLGSPRVCVVGDLMLDTYVWGRVSRVSPEGPIPVLHVDRKEHRPGGAGSVAAMLCALGGQVCCVGVVGEDEPARQLQAGLKKAGADTGGLVACPDRPTILKTRYLGYVQSAGRGVQQIVRVDEERTDPIGPEQSRRVLREVRERLAEADMVLLQDMAKGLFTPELLRSILQEARGSETPAIVDPERGGDYGAYRGATYVVPNRFEAQAASGIEMNCPENWQAAARKLIEVLDARGVIIKLDRDGMFYATREEEGRQVSTPVREVADVTGAGDMVAAMLCLAGAGGAELEQAVELANVAAGLEVSRQGATAIPRAEVLGALRADTSPALRKVKGREEIKHILGERRRRGQTVAFTNGTFDLLHLGHVELIRFARAQADCLVVGLNSDRSVRQYKGPGRPINSEEVRAQTLASLPNVDHVVIFDEANVLPLVKEIRPDVLVKGGDYDKSGVVGAEFVESYGGQVKLAPRVEGLSTSELIRRINENGEGSDQQNP